MTNDDDDNEIIDVDTKEHARATTHAAVNIMKNFVCSDDTILRYIVDCVINDSCRLPLYDSLCVSTNNIE